ncbi:MFP1 attachment factor like [Actinidia chinensis var. chinensis]|uniref:MFP1 attachment factor like n=1 Tax=Actinidia chinensis var. chinensis TaxID=1590841 RepID=A0A2R6QY19_ACTCC|nr:MFP1 attachment factor like [Actinidia chinensis var. chinensis]
MTDQNEERNLAVEEQEPLKPQTMAETEQTPPPQHTVETATSTDKSFSIWPPTKRTREAVVNRLIETLSTPSVLSKRYGTLPADEANATARRIEEETFAAASAAAIEEDDGIEILQVYSKHISKLMLEAVKSRSASGSAPEGDSAVESPAAIEEISSIET